MYLSEAYILMMSELACAGGLIIMNGKGAVRSTVGLAIAFVAYTVLLGMLTSYIVSHSVKNSVVFLIKKYSCLFSGQRPRDSNLLSLTRK